MQKNLLNLPALDGRASARKIKEALLQQEQSDISDLYTPSITRVEV